MKSITAHYMLNMSSLHAIVGMLGVPRRLFIGLLLIILLGITGCGQLSDTEQEYLDKQREEKEEAGAFRKDLESGAETTEVIKQVQDFRRDDGLTNEEWLDRYMARHKQVASVVWDDWVSRKIDNSEDKYEVSYRFSLLNAQYESTKHGLVWRVDNVIDRVLGPREMTPEELGSRGGRSGKSQADRSRLRARDSLE